MPSPIAARKDVSGPIDNPPPQRKWASPFKRCKSQDGTREGWISVGEGGRRCEYDIRAAGVVRPVPVPSPIAAHKDVGGPIDNPPPQRKWASPFERCKSQDGTREGWVSVGEGGRRCEYDIAKPRSSEPSARD